MGYAVGSLLLLGDLIKSSQSPIRRVFDLGSQDVMIMNDGDARQLASFVASFGGDSADFLTRIIGNSFPKMLTARDVFVAANFDYLCCDVDRRPGTVYVDFNTLQFDRSLYGKFDLVMNAGTTEHLPNPVAALFLMHQLCRPGGMLFNEVPMAGWFNHGLNNLTPKFWHTLRWMNSYDVLSAQTKVVPDASLDDGNFGGPHLSFIENLASLGGASASIEIVFLKRAARGFVPPFDAVIPTDDGGKATADLVWGSLIPFAACGALTADDAAQATNDFLAMQQLPYRISNPASGAGSTPLMIRMALSINRALPESVRRSSQLEPVKRYFRKKLTNG